jgi:hypothetical protein
LLVELEQDVYESQNVVGLSFFEMLEHVASVERRKMSVGGEEIDRNDSKS